MVPKRVEGNVSELRRGMHSHETVMSVPETYLIFSELHCREGCGAIVRSDGRDG